ncbi:MAG: hypothetical protein RL357_1534 [Pseudomonadota bacterium]
MQVAYQHSLNAFGLGRWVRGLSLGFCLCTGVACAASPAERMLQGGQAWIAEQRGVSVDAVGLGEIDARLEVPVCQETGGWRYDFPFSSQDTLRARCGKPVIQFYVRVLKGGGPAEASAPKQAETPAATRPAVVLRKGLLRGAVLSATDLQVVEVAISELPMQSIDNLDNAVDAELTRDVLAGRPLRSADLRPAMMVKRGQTVTLTIRQPSGFSVAAQVEALQDGRKGDSIRLKNRESGRILTGKVVGPNSLEAQ